MTASTQTESAIRVISIDHISIIVRDLEASRHFYVDILGMQQVPRPAFKFPGLWFQAGATLVHLIGEHPGSAPAGYQEPAEKAGTLRVGHFAFGVEDAYAALETLKQCGVRLRGNPSMRPDGYLQVFCYDPDGHVVELFSRAR